jgi:hypothetical protein
MTSSAYRQSTTFDPAAHGDAQRLDPENRLLWRQRLRRLEAEAVRDAVLCVAGTLNPQLFGPPVPVQRKPDGEVAAPADALGSRRSVYLQVRRSQPLTLLQIFDQPVMETNCTQRGTSTVSSQALTLLNSDFLVRQAEIFADRVRRESLEDPAAHALRLAFGRPATQQERATLREFLTSQEARHATVLAAGPETAKPGEAVRRALADLCHMLLSANEFVYVD